jgi:hypothetical protein
MGIQNRLAELKGGLAEGKLYSEEEIRADENLDEIVGKSAACLQKINKETSS